MNNNNAKATPVFEVDLRKGDGYHGTPIEFIGKAPATTQRHRLCFLSSLIT